MVTLVIAVVVATIISYILNREWSFRTRGGRERHHEAALFFLVNGIGIVLGTVAKAFLRQAPRGSYPDVFAIRMGERYQVVTPSGRRYPIPGRRPLRTQQRDKTVELVSAGHASLRDIPEDERVPLAES